MGCNARIRNNLLLKLDSKGGSLFVICVILLCTIFYVQAEEDRPSASNTNSDSHVSNIRYRTRPVASFRSTKPSNSTNNSTDSEGPEPSGVPFIAVHDLTSQTFEKLHENWRNLEAFIRNLQARRSQEENLRSSSQNGDGSRRPSSYNNNNVYTLKYHPVVLEGEGSSSSDDGVRSNPPRNINGNYQHFNPFYPYDPKGQVNTKVDMEKHTVATIYTIGICLTIMAIGSVMFILINKCDGSSGTSYVRTTGNNSNGNRITRSVMGVAARAGRQIHSGRGRNSRRGRNASNNENVQHATSSMSTSPVSEIDVKILTDLPPSYASLFPEGCPGPKPPDFPDTTLTTTTTVNVNTQNQSTVEL